MYFPVVDLSLISSVLLTCAVLILALYYYNTRYVGVWEKCGVPGPKSWPAFNHEWQFGKDHDRVLQMWQQQYGRTYGTYCLYPYRPTLVTTDVKLLRQIMIKDFGSFQDRFFFKRSKASVNHGLFLACGNSWRKIRHKFSPMFSTTKLKMMLTHVNATAENTKNLILNCSRNGELIPLKDFAVKYASDIIARLGFGLEAHSVSKKESEFGHYSRVYLRFSTPIQKFVDTLTTYCPQAFQIALRLGLPVDVYDTEADKYFVNLLDEEIEKLKKKKENNENAYDKTRNMLQMHLDAKRMGKDNDLEDSDSRKLTMSEIYGNINNTVLAAVDTVSTTFENTIYQLALHPDIQDRVYAELVDVIPEKGEITYDSLSRLRFMENVIDETLRVNPVIPSITRVASEAKTYDGITIPKDAIIHVPISRILKDPEYWPEPDKFDPDRFTVKKKSALTPLAFSAFGDGPRGCVGKRLGYMELKVILATLLREFKFELSERTEPKKGQEVEMMIVEQGFPRHKLPLHLEAVLREGSTNDMQD